MYIGPNTGTTIDLIWDNAEAADRIIKCIIAEDHDHDSDHLAIETVLAKR